MADDLTAKLSELGEYFEDVLSRAVGEEAEWMERALALVAAVEAGLRVADELYAPEVPESAESEAMMWLRQDCAERFREAIRTALGGEPS